LKNLGFGLEKKNTSLLDKGYEGTSKNFIGTMTKIQKSFQSNSIQMEIFVDFKSILEDNQPNVLWDCFNNYSPFIVDIFHNAVLAMSKDNLTLLNEKIQKVYFCHDTKVKDKIFEFKLTDKILYLSQQMKDYQKAYVNEYFIGKILQLLDTNAHNQYLNNSQKESQVLQKHMENLQIIQAENPVVEKQIEPKKHEKEKEKEKETWYHITCNCGYLESERFKKKYDDAERRIKGKKTSSNKCGNCHCVEKDIAYEVVEVSNDGVTRWIAVANCGKVQDSSGHLDIIEAYKLKKAYFCDGHKNNSCNKCNKKQWEHTIKIIKK